MVLGLLIISAIPTTVGVCQALSAQKRADAAAKEKAKFCLSTTVSLDGKRPVECPIVLKGGRLWIDHPAFPMPGHPFTGYYFTYPSEEEKLGLVSTIAEDPPMLNWIFVDKDNNLLRHGARGETLGGHVIGPWYWTGDEEWLTLDKDDSQFIAVLLPNDKWTIAWDRDGKIKNSGEDVSGGETEEESETEEEDEEANEDQEKRGKGVSMRKQKSKGRGGGGFKWVPIRLHRDLKMGMKSQYVKGAGEKKEESSGEKG